MILQVILPYTTLYRIVVLFVLLAFLLQSEKRGRSGRLFERAFLVLNCPFSLTLEDT